MRNSYKSIFERKHYTRSSRRVARLKVVLGSNLLRQNYKSSSSVSIAWPKNLNCSGNYAKLRENRKK